MTQNNPIKQMLLTFIAACTMMGSTASFAQDNTLLPELPTPIKNLVDEGAQVRFLGKDFGVEGWVAIKNGQEQYFYVLPNSGGFISGILFDDKGQAVTIKQVSRLRAQNGGALLDTLAADAPSKITNETTAQKYEFKTPSEQLFWDIENSNWIPVGQAGTPVFYSFIDPQCPHCHTMMNAMKSYIDDGRVQVRLIPVGFKEETRAQAAFLLATPAPAQVWWRHLAGDKTVLPAKQEINQQGVQRNLSIMQSWKLNVTPLIIYRGKDQKVKIIRGKVKDIEALIRDLGART
ncbi:MAG: thiol:disulfide interchange protein [Alphaproteobacteria bacterium]|nr:MAG: thiol:disulfide interchange protein [Alphaproteobacteria bacterium]